LGDFLKNLEKVYNQLRVFEEIEEKCLKPTYNSLASQPSLENSTNSAMTTNSGVSNLTSSGSEPKTVTVSQLIKKLSNQNLMRSCQRDLRSYFIEPVMVGLE
jgi:hypothetical protein